jgi:1,4-dihydroxy-2-naphthoate octaprenyltransferase
MSLKDVRDCFVHLRLKFQLLLSPIFLLGFVIAGGQIGRALILGYIAFHVFGYAGGTAFNSYYDRDIGPIGGLEHPPPVPTALLAFSLIWQLIGLGLAYAASWQCAAIYLVMFLMSTAYSHPSIRWKGRALAGLATVAFGQGILGYLGGWTCAGLAIAGVLTAHGLLGMVAATLITLGFYPLTGIYQIEEDRARGDQTFPVWQGPAQSFRFAITCFLIGGAAAISLILIRYQAVEALVLGLVLAGVLIAVWHWSRTFDPSAIVSNFRTVMWLYTMTSLGFMGWLALHLLGIL